MKKSEKAVVGTWRITEMDAWDADAFDMDGPALITIRADRTGTLQFCMVQGDIDARVIEVDGAVRAEFTWSGIDENDPVSGRGWLVVKGDHALGHFYAHLGDDSGFKAIRVG